MAGSYMIVQIVISNIRVECYVHVGMRGYIICICNV